jgi:hypothetical protein
MAREAQDRVAVDVTIDLDRHLILATLRDIQGLADPDAVKPSRCVSLSEEDFPDGDEIEWVG